MILQSVPSDNTSFPKLSAYVVIVVLCLLAISQPRYSCAQEFHPGLSLQGFTGILNTPNAYVTTEGTFEGLYSGQIENQWRDMTTYQDNYLFSVGFFKIAEIGGRLTWAPQMGAKDLSGNAKLTTAPFTRKYPAIPVLAFGMQDLSGGAKFLQTKYLVVSQDIWRFRLSAGYGFGPDRMKGVFGGAEFKAHDWVYLLGEYDTKETNVGARVITPQFWKNPVSITATAKTSLKHKPGNFDIAVGLSFPLDFNVKEKEQRAPDKTAPVTTPKTTAAPGAVEKSDKTVPVTSLQRPAIADKNDTTAKLTALKERLIRAGFLNVRVGTQFGKTLVVEYENSIFNHNELDALGVVGGMAAEGMKGYYENLQIVIKKKDIRMMQVSMPLSSLADYLTNQISLATLKASTVISQDIEDDSDVLFVGGSDNSSFLTTSLVLAPGLKTWVGTDYGAFDYVLSFKPDLYVNLWKGATANARWDIPFSWSRNLNKGEPLWFNDGRTPARLERLMFSQGMTLFSGVTANLSAGQILPDIYGTLNELIWSPGNGAHRLKLSQSWSYNDKTRQNRQTYLAAYRYYFSPLDISIEGTGGKFWSQDLGYLVELKRMFGDTAVSVYYKYSTNSDSNAWIGISHWQSVGLSFTFPLTPEKDMKHYYKVQVRGSNEWRYGNETTIASANEDNSNYLPPRPIASIPTLSTSLDSQYLNRDRLSETYINSHLERLKSAWLKYNQRLQ